VAVIISLALRGIDLGYVSLEELKLSRDRSWWHTSSGGPDLELALASIDLPHELAAIDMGCGKAGALITLSRYFAIADGVEICPVLSAVARRNVQRLGIGNVKIFCCDAADFTDLDHYQVLYMFNPFPAVIVERVVEHLNESLARRPRNITAIYVNPTCHEVFIRNGFRKVNEFMVLSHGCNVYIHDSPRHFVGPCTSGTRIDADARLHLQEKLDGKGNLLLK
jgi:hypothetical protein